VLVGGRGEHQMEERGARFVIFSYLARSLRCDGLLEVRGRWSGLDGRIVRQTLKIESGRGKKR
jgi:hypothetical protein